MYMYVVEIREHQQLQCMHKLAQTEDYVVVVLAKIRYILFTNKMYFITTFAQTQYNCKHLL